MFHHFCEVPSVLSISKEMFHRWKNLSWSSVNVIQKDQNEHKSLLCPFVYPRPNMLHSKTSLRPSFLKHHSQDINLSSLRWWLKISSQFEKRKTSLLIAPGDRWPWIPSFCEISPISFQGKLLWCSLDLTCAGWCEGKGTNERSWGNLKSFS